MDQTDLLWRHLARVAARYPSPHNTQPLRLRVDDPRTATILFDRTAALPAHPLGVLFGHVTVGVYLECLSVAAHASGHVLDVDLVEGPVRPLDAGQPDDPGQPGPEAPAGRWQRVARVSLVDVGTRVDDLDPGLLERRRTSRLPYDGRDVAPYVLRRVADECVAAGHRFATSGHAPTVAEVVALDQEALFDDLRTPLVRHELAQWVRTSERAARASRDGFSPRTLGTPGPLLRAVLTHPRFWLGGPAAALTRRVRRGGSRGTPRVAWLRGPLRDEPDAVAAGRLLLRVWLVLTEEGVAVHPYGSLVTGPRALPRFHRLVGELGQDGLGTWMILRLGHSAEPPCSLRRPLEDMLVLPAGPAPVGIAIEGAR